MGTRRKARECAMQCLYRRLIAPPAIDSLLEELNPESQVFAKLLLDGTLSHLDEIDKLLVGSSTNWRIDRMAAVDRSILRLAVYELAYESDIPVKVTINEAVDLAKKFGSKNSGAFVNGVLDKISKGLSSKKES